ncbi:uncharacterized protein YALI1_C20032g [Yarrowia lipolytica]|uniref:Uncharacterized protein n=1 Tax=Yarrowia lipolytica TaxID=4952 RepID=A0A1D8NB57_YARLL|nr:hypothetical protein YALI1_C20032g [Yarrowia lipolytica]
MAAFRGDVSLAIFDCDLKNDNASALNKYESSIAISKSWKTELERQQLAVSQFQKRRVNRIQWQPSTTPEEDPSELRRLAAKTPADADEDDTHKETRIYSPKEFKTVRSGIPPTQIV